MTRLQNSFGRVSLVDWRAVGLYVVLALLGWINIYAAVYDDSQTGVFDFSLRYGQQLKWIGVSGIVAVVIMLIDTKFYHMFAYPAYIVSIIVLLSVLFFGRTVNGAKAWIYIGSTALQPVEFVKFATSLALARFMSRYSFSITGKFDLIGIGLIIMLPVAIIFLQNDAGSAVVFGALIFVLYREGLNGWFYIALFLILVLFLASLVFTSTAILISLLFVTVVFETFSNGYIRQKIIYLSLVALLSLLLYIVFNVVFPIGLSIFYSILISFLLSFVLVVLYSYRHHLRNVFTVYSPLFFLSLLFTFTVDYMFDNVLQLHQRKRILHLLRLESDTQNWGYNVAQSEIAIGSGGLFGKGYMEGTQTRYNFVPEQSTDFIFCTVGEEWGFVGSTIVVALFCMLILRLMKMAELQHDSFGRIYCYSVAAIFFAHVFINIGMTIGIMPVIGIPLPFFSYGGSSFLAFTVLYFVAVKFDSGRRELLRR